MKFIPLKYRNQTYGVLRKLLARTIPDSYKLKTIANMSTLKTWEKKQTSFPTFETRYEMYDFIQKKYLENDSVDYLEFGVYEGASIDYWRKLNQNSQSRFYGFDTFTGLPEAWKNVLSDIPSGTWTTNGNLPKIDDKRVVFYKGLFQETINPFLEKYQPDNKIVIHNDSDLYSSSLYLLTRLDDMIKKNTIIIFDEFSNVMHEFKALEDYCSAYNRKYKVIAATKNFYQQVAIKFEN
jgi:O-methyltransferase